MSEINEKVNGVLDTTTKAVGLVGVIAWTGAAVCWCGTMVKSMWDDHKEKKRQKIFDEGYEAGLKSAREEIEILKISNNELYAKALAKSEGAAE